MRLILRPAFSWVLCVLLAAQVGGAQTPVFEPAFGSKPLRIERDSKLILVLAEPISSATAKRGQRVRMELGEPWVVDGRVLLPKGTSAVGIVRRVQRSIPGKRDGRVVITTGSIKLPSGKTVPLAITLPDGEDCDDVGPCVFVYGLWALLASPILLVEAPILLVKAPAAIKEQRRAERTNPYHAIESELLVGDRVDAATKRRIKLP